MKNNLFVVFHRATGENISQEAIDKLEASVLNIVPDAAVCYKPYKPGSSQSTQPHPKYFLNGQTPSEAVDIICEKAGGREVVLVTLCDKMKHAASGRNFTLVTVGLPPEGTDFPRGVCASHTTHIGAHLQKLVR